MTTKPTIIVAVDREHLPELAVSLPTWRKNVEDFDLFPAMIIFDDDYDGMKESIARSEVFDMISMRHGPTRFISSRSIVGDMTRQGGQPITQREKMLTALAFAPLHVSTPTYLKLDTDTIALPVADSLLSCGVLKDAPIAAPRWGYTKPGSWIDTLDQWADQVAPGNVKPYREPAGRIARSKRIISYAMLGSTAFARQCLSLLGGSNRLPVPSQDTFYWYCCELLGKKCQRLSPNSLQWRHAGGNMRKLKELASEAMQ